LVLAQREIKPEEARREVESSLEELSAVVEHFSLAEIGGPTGSKSDIEEIRR
jgi:hypothetical protein